jgi:hypothetical protein
VRGVMCCSIHVVAFCKYYLLSQYEHLFDDKTTGVNCKEHCALGLPAMILQLSSVLFSVIHLC